MSPFVPRDLNGELPASDRTGSVTSPERRLRRVVGLGQYRPHDRATCTAHEFCRSVRRWS